MYEAGGASGGTGEGGHEARGALRGSAHCDGGRCEEVAAEKGATARGAAAVLL